MDLMDLSGPTGPEMGVQTQKLQLSFYTVYDFGEVKAIICVYGRILKF